MCSIRKFLAFYSHFEGTSGEMSNFRVTSGHLRPCDVISCHVTASSCELQSCRKWNAQYTRVFGLLRALPGDSVKSHHFRVTSGNLRSRDVISCHVTASSCELEPCKKWNAQYMRDFGLLQPLPGDFRSNPVTSRSLPVTWDHVTSF